MAARRSIAEAGKLFAQEVADDDLMGMAGEVAYNLLLALFPGLIFVAALAGFVGGALGVENLFTQVLDALRQFMPPAALEMVTEPIRQVLSTQSSELLSIGAIGALWAASGATAVMMKGCNRAHGIKETRPFWLHRLVIAIGLTLVLMLLLLVAFIALALGEQLLADGLLRAGLDTTLATIWQYARWPLSLLSIITALALLYWLGPNVRQRFRLFSPGVIGATLLWLLVTGPFQVLVFGLVSYSATYGALAGIIILLLWLNYSGLIFLLGTELDQVLDPRGQLQAAVAPAVPVGDIPGTPPPSFGRGDATPITAGPAWLAPATLAAWTVIIIVGALRRAHRR